MPVTGFHSVIESPLSVSRVAPPTSTMAKHRMAHATSGGASLWLHAWLTLAFAAALLVLFDLKVRREERWLCERYPGYAEYQTRVKKLVPWIW